MHVKRENRDGKEGYAPTHVLFPVRVKERLKDLATRRGTSVSELVREAVERYLEEAEKEERL